MFLNEIRLNMGWDVVEIGLRHNLPVYDPYATAQEVAKRMKQNVRLVYEKEYEYDSVNNVVSWIDDFELIELEKYNINGSDDYLQMEVSNYQAKQIQKLAGIEKLRKATFTDENAELILDDLEDPFELYRIEDEEKNLYICIYKENVDLDVSVDGRWDTWADAFYPSSPYREWLRNYRMLIYKRAKLFGCKEVIICADQGPTELIYDKMEYSADDLKEYARSFQYIKEDTSWVDETEKDDWKEHAKHIMFSSVFQEQFALSREDWVEVIYDDFSDIDK